MFYFLLITSALNMQSSQITLTCMLELLRRIIHVSKKTIAEVCSEHGDLIQIDRKGMPIILENV